MSTRSLIGIVNEDGSCQTIYCHWDGYPEYNGKLLLESYSDLEKIQSLLALGDISLLAENVAPTTDSNHSFETPIGGIVVAYHRDRGEDYSPPRHWKSKDETAKEGHKCYWAEYVYLYENNQWVYCTTLGRGKYKYHPLKNYKFAELK